MVIGVSVVGAVIVEGGRVLCARRGEGGALPGLWEFPGGKIEPGESPQTALQREIFEELGCEVAVGDLVTTTAYDYDFARIFLATYWCSLSDEEPDATEHAELAWVEPSNLLDLQWAPADIPAVEIVAASVGS